ncbi:hypothetical protein QOV31_005192 (plasmid) [Agrobacterium fabrum]|uniref:hypothetical protein n=1 Tax=Rhizobium/Agrobacterium group TaxID=227290 RepID=UPI0009C096DD|nr:MULTISPECIES: hypothetical protein [Rhizobium/Agrobacterium group]NMV72395.1 hypothetical protein [Agrobacterium fabrum]NTF72607.1 hypothetical protein [Rhizobium rhizogenes]NTI85319.1 hypothetical protein [Rhizobium rhizogenes]NTJ27502.1 hypothetical protein [Rhizobium rhizogenes]QRM41892.1 hypothetical protein F3X89_29165 [Rhizobium rhizogenes]
MEPSQRILNDDSRASRTEAPSTSTNADMPPELLAKVATYIPTQDPVETARNLGSLERTGRAGREAVTSDPVGKYHARMKRIGASARTVFDTVIPGNQLPEWETNRPSPTARTKAVGPILKFQSEGGKSRFVTNILNLPESAQCGAILSVIKHLDDLGEANKTRLIERSIEILRLDPPLTWNMGQKCPAADVLVEGERYLNADQRARIQQERSSRPRLSPLFRRAYADFEVQKNMDANPIRYRDAAEPEVRPIDTVIETIERYSASLARRGPNDIGLLTANGSFEKNINDAYARTRAELDASSRDRNRSGLSR